MADIESKIERLVSSLVEARREYAELTDDEVPTEQLGKPCTAAQLKELEALFGHPLPPSYRAFLTLHDGWGDFSGEAKILSVEDQKAKWVKARVREFEGLAREFKAKNPFEGGALPVMLGPTEHGYVVLSSAKARRDGEFDFVAYDLQEELHRFPDFAAYLKHELELTKELIAEEREGASEEED